MLDRIKVVVYCGAFFTGKVLLSILVLLRPKYFSPKPTCLFLSLTKDQILHRDSTSDFLRFLNEDRFIFKNHFILIEMRNWKLPRKVSDGLQVNFTRDLGFYLLFNSIPRRIAFRTLWNLTDTLKVFNLQDTLLNNAKNYKKSVFDLAVWKVYIQSQYKKIVLVTTQTHLNKLPVFFNFPKNNLIRIMVWYSVNSNRVFLVDYLGTRRQIGYEVINSIDQHYTWNSSSFNRLVKEGVDSNKCQIVGSIIFQPLPNKKATREFSLNILFFDVIPFQGSDNFYNVDMAVQTLSTLISAVEEINSRTSEKFKLQVKPKRSLKAGHAYEYWEFLKYSKELGQLDILSPNQDIYELIGAAKAVLAVPFTSPVAIAHELLVPASYCYSGSGEWDIDDANDSAEVILKSQLEVVSWLSGI